MRLLIIGGTGFLGYHTATAALEAGHDVTLFNRGRSRPDAFPGVPRLTGDRKTGDVAALETIDNLDAVIDCTGYFPHEVEASTAILRKRANRYLFVSTISVYDDPVGTIDEDAPLAAMPADADTTALTGGTYGPLKVQCEQAARDAFGDDAVIVRPGLIVGPEDPTDRFTYWVRRGVVGGTILAPGDPNALTQVIDGRDLATWMVPLALGSTSSTFNGVAPQERFGEMLDLCAVAPDATLRWIADKVLLAKEVQPWSDLPLWLGGDDFACETTRSAAAGLATRPIAETIADTRAWDEARGMPPLKAGISAERETELLG